MKGRDGELACFIWYAHMDDKTGRTTVIESIIATVTHMHASPLLNGVYLMKNVSNLDAIMLHRCSTVSTL